MILLFMYGYALTLDVDNVRTIVYDQDRTAASRDFLERFTESRYFTVVATAASHAEVERALDSGRAQVGLVIPTNFARDLDLGRQVSVQALLDGSDANTATLALAYLEGITSRYSNRLATERAGLARRDPPVETRLRVWYNPELESRNYIIPGLIAVIMMVIAALLTSLTVAREWEQGTMEQLIATPIRVPELVMGKLLPYFAIGLLDVILCVAAGTLVFGVPFRGNLALLLALALVFLLGAMSLGILVSIKVKSQVVASQVALTLTFLPAFLLSGFVFDIANLPGWLQAITYAVPARYFVTILKGVFLKGVGLRLLGLEAVFLALFALIVTVMANRAFRKNLE
jgi:ABC-2 type transport system permease protein